MAAYKKVDAEQLDAGLTAIAEAIRAKTGGTELLSFPDGLTSEVDAVFETGKQAAYDAFWDEYQENGDRRDYYAAFAGSVWTTDTFRPKYSIKPISCSRMFAMASKLAGVNLHELLDDAGCTLDTSECTDFFQMFLYQAPWHIPPLDTRSCDTIQYLSYNSGLNHVTLIVRDDGSQKLVIPFYYESSLSDLTIEGTIGQNGFDVHWSPLNKASLTSVINALSTTTSGLTVTLSMAAVNTAFETSDGAADGSASEEWLTLVATKSNWTISLV